MYSGEPRGSLNNFWLSWVREFYFKTFVAEIEKLGELGDFQQSFMKFLTKMATFGHQIMIWSTNITLIELVIN